MPCGGAIYGDDNLVFIANDWHTALLPVYLQVSLFASLQSIRNSCFLYLPSASSKAATGITQADDDTVTQLQVWTAMQSEIATRTRRHIWPRKRRHITGTTAR